MARYVLIATLLQSLDPAALIDEGEKALLSNYLNAYKTLLPSLDTNDNTQLLDTTQVDGANGSGGDSIADTQAMRISSSGKTAQRFLVSPVPRSPINAYGDFERIIKFAPLLRTEICLIFESLNDYYAHMNTYRVLYEKLFGYVVLVRATQPV
jgi:hypothetical protein